MFEDFVLGYNQGWFSTCYGSDLSTGWSEATAVYAAMRYLDGKVEPCAEGMPVDSGIDGFFAMARGCGARVVRLWAFESYSKEGCDYGSRESLDGIKGLTPAFEHHVHQVMQAAMRYGVQVYWTALVGNWPRHWRSPEIKDIGRWRRIHYNILHNRYNAQQAYHEHALGPFVKLLSAYENNVYALDLMNEVQGSLRDFWGSDWNRVRRWIKHGREFVRGVMPSLKVTASCGHHTAVTDVLEGRVSDLGLDFYDLHLYNDEGRIPQMQALGRLALADATPLLLGEFGQRDGSYNDEVQTRVVREFIQKAYDHGFLGALAWRLDDYRPGESLDASRHTYVYPHTEEGERIYYARPAVRVIQAGISRVA